jgi:hypothetical protein
MTNEADEPAGEKEMTLIVLTRRNVNQEIIIVARFCPFIPNS